GDLVETGVVREHKALTLVDESTAVLHEHGGRLPTDESRAVEVRAREARRTEVGLRAYRHGSAAERSVTLHVGRLRRLAVVGRPAQRVENLLADSHAVAGDPVTRRRQTGGQRR